MKKLLGISTIFLIFFLPVIIVFSSIKSPVYSAATLFTAEPGTGDETGNTNGEENGEENGEDEDGTGIGTDLEEIPGPDIGQPEHPWQLLMKKVKKVIGVLLTIAAVIAVVVIMIGGYLYISSAGDQAKATQGKNAVIGAVIGLIIAFAAYAIVSLISDKLG